MDEDLEREMMRKSFHLFFGASSSALIYFGFAKWWHFLILLIIGGGAMLYIHKTKKSLLLFSNMLSAFGREKEFPGLGAITYVIGIIISILLFSKDIAAASIMILAVGDAVSPIIGMHFGKVKTIFSKRKMVEGFIVGVILSFLAAAPIVGYTLAFFASLISLFAEFWDETDFIDDNILIPLVAGTVMTLILMI